MPAAEVNGVTLHHQVHGAGDWVVFVHGGGGTHLTWWRQLHAFGASYRCLAYDARGLGQSDGVEDAPAGGDDLLALMDHLGIERAHLVGHSAGGWAVSHIAQHHPARARSLVMTDTPFGFFTPEVATWAAEMLVKLAAGFDVDEHAVAPAYAATDPEGWYFDRAVARLTSAVRPEAGTGYTKRFGSVYEHLRDAPRDDYRSFGVPTLFTVGADDALTVPWLIRGTARRVGGARLAVIPASGHAPQQEQADVYNALLAEFFAHVEARERDPAYEPPPWSLVEHFDRFAGEPPEERP